jgi:hypothetical protein
VYRELACEEGDCPSNYKCCPDSCFNFKICRELVGLVTEEEIIPKDVPSSVIIASVTTAVVTVTDSSTTTPYTSSSTFPATENVTAVTITKSTEVTNTVTSSSATETIGSDNGDDEDVPTSDRYIINTSTPDIISLICTTESVSNSVEVFDGSGTTDDDDEDSNEPTQATNSVTSSPRTSTIVSTSSTAI